jgi:hypothetical protein
MPTPGNEHGRYQGNRQRGNKRADWRIEATESDAPLGASAASLSLRSQSKRRSARAGEPSDPPCLIVVIEPKGDVDVGDSSEAPVGGIVIDDDHLPWRAFESGFDALEKNRNVGRFLVDRDDDRKGRIRPPGVASPAIPLTLNSFGANEPYLPVAPG